MAEAEADSRGRPEPRADFVDGVVRVAFLVRLLALLFVLFMPVSSLTQGRVVGAVLLIAATSVFGFFWHTAAFRSVRRHPIVAVVDVLLAAVVTTLVDAGSPAIFYTYGTALLVGVLLPPLSAGLVGLVLVLGVTLGMLDTGAAAVENVLVVTATCVMVVLLGAAARTLHEQILVEHEQASRLRADAVKHEERARLARDMHDSVAKSLHGIGLAAAALPGWVEKDPRAGVKRANEIAHAVASATEQARTMLTGLRDQIDTRPLEVLLTERVERFRQQSGIDVMLDLRGSEQVVEPARSELTLIVDEALENVTRHAAAQRVTVSCREVDGSIIVEVVDDGHGFDPTASVSTTNRFGLVGMTERASSVGGRADVTSAPGAGTRVSIVVPSAHVAVETAGGRAR